MVSEQILKIIIKAEDMASQQADKIKDKFKGLGDTAQKSNLKVTQSAQLTQKQMESLSHHIAGVVKSTDKISEGKTKFQQYTQSVNESQIAFKRLDSETQNMLRYLSQMSDKGRETFLGMSSNARDAVSKFNEMKMATSGWNNTLDITKTKMQLAGTNVDSLKGKIQVVGSAIPTYLGSKWDSLKGKVSSFGGFIKSNLTSALSTVRSKIESLGSAFSGLGGIISSVFGGIGLKSLTDMTIGASISRDRVFNLSYAILGAGQSMEDFKNKSDSLWNQMDADTNQSLVGLDQISQAMSVINMSANASQDQLKALEPLILDIGQRAILMGKDGEEAVSLMQAAGKGLNGEFEMLRENLGITKDKLLDAGWDGSAEDIDGYTRALGECLKQSGDVSDMMNTTSGKLTRIKKYWGLAGRSLGDEFLPSVDQALDHLVRFLDADNDGALDERGKKWMQYAYGAMAVASGFATLAPSIAPALSVLDNLAGKTKSVLTFFGLMKGAEDALTISTLSNTIAEKANTIAKMAGGAAAVTATGANAGLTASLWAMATALLANPITWVVVALIALAAAVYEVGKAFGWWTDVGSMLQAIWAGIQRLWNAFINHPDVQATIGAIYFAFQVLCDWIGQAWNAICEFFNISTGSDWDIVSGIIQGVGFAWETISWKIKFAISILQGVWGVLTWIVSVAQGVGQGVYNALKPIVCILLGCSPGIVPALHRVYEIFVTVWNEVLSFVSGIISSVVSAIQPIIDILTQIAEFYLSAFIFAWQTLLMVFTTVIMSINQIITTFSMFLSGQISLATMLSLIWNTIQVMFATVLSIILTRVRTFATALVARAIATGRGFVNGIINFLTQLPGKVWAILVVVASRIASAGAQWVSAAKSNASSIVSGVISYVSQLPGKVYTEFMNIGSRMMEAGSQLVEKAKQIGKSIVDGILNAMDIHSPGEIQTKVVTEFKNMVKRVSEYIKPAGETAKEFGETIVDRFGDVELTPNIGYTDLDAEQMPSMDMNVGMDTSQVDSTNTLVTRSYDNLANITGNALQTMVDKDKLAYETIRINDANTLSLMSTNLSLQMGTMTGNVSNNLNNIVAKNRTSMNNVNNTTKSNLNSIVTKTKNANTQMIKSWGIMKDGIIKAADQIKKESTGHFNKLSNTIGTFYGKLKNPSRWGAGSPMPSSRGRRSHGFGKITNAIQNASLPKYLSLGQIKRNPLIHMNDFGDYVTRDKKTGLFTVSDLLKYGAIQIGKGAGGYDTIPSPNVKLIKDTSKEWDMKGPLVGKYQTNHGFKVKEFLTGVPKITFDVFRSIAEDVFGQTQYEFYYDDDHHGNWVNAFNAGSMNCKHGAEAIIALAETMGLSGHMVHGHWNQFGHYWAEIEGHKMDVTGWQQRRTWTPSASAGPAPTNTIGDIFNELKSIIKPTKSNDEKFEGKLDVNINLENVPKHIDADTLIQMLTSKEVLDKFVGSREFQALDNEIKAKINGRTIRARGG